MRPQRLKDTFFKMYHLMVKQTYKQLKHNELCSIKRNMQMLWKWSMQRNNYADGPLNLTEIKEAARSRKTANSEKIMESFAAMCWS